MAPVYSLQTKPIKGTVVVQRQNDPPNGASEIVAEFRSLEDAERFMRLPAMFAALTAAELILRAYIPEDRFDGHAAKALRLVREAIAQVKGE